VNFNLTLFGVASILSKSKICKDRVIIPEAVLQEISAIASRWLATTIIQIPQWVEVRPVTDRLLVNSLLLDLDRGEAEAIILAMELKADLLLLDERRGSKVASRFGIRTIGLLGVLIEAKHKGIITAARPLLDDLIVKAGFWVSRELYARVLEAAEE
jgi:hypothetical protein